MPMRTQSTKAKIALLAGAVVAVAVIGTAAAALSSTPSPKVTPAVVPTPSTTVAPAAAVTPKTVAPKTTTAHKTTVAPTATVTPKTATAPTAATPKTATAPKTAPKTVAPKTAPKTTVAPKPTAGGASYVPTTTRPAADYHGPGGSVTPSGVKLPPGPTYNVGTNPIVVPTYPGG